MVGEISFMCYVKLDYKWSEKLVFIIEGKLVV